jgi:hypothetical protein
MSNSSGWTDCWFALEKTLLKGKHPLFVTDGQHTNVEGATIRQIVQGQGRTFFESVSTKELLADKVQPVQTFGDIAAYIRAYRVQYEKLPHIEWHPALFDTEPEAKMFAMQLFLLGVLQTPCYQDKEYHRNMIILDDPNVIKHPRWQELLNSKSHVTGPDPRNRTIVFSSIGMLGNMLAARRNGWNVTAATDGTHNVSNTSYILIAFGVVGNDIKGTRSFFPVAYAFGEGEREITALHLYLNILAAMKHLFGVSDVQFNGGIVSDHNSALVNAIQHAFPRSPPLQCYTHIIRKFMSPDKRKGNGGYAKHLCNTRNRKFLFDVAYKDVANLHRCKTMEQFLRYGELMEEAWVANGEEEMANTFTKVYIDNEQYCHWRYNSSGIPGCVADNQPLESHQGCQKGGPNRSGLLATGSSMGVLLRQELPKLIYRMTLQKTNFKVEEPILDYEAMTADGLLFKFFREFDFEKNRFPYKEGFICCALEELHRSITEEDVQLMEDSERGIFGGDYTQREELLSRTSRFHVIKEVEKQTGVKVWTCDCYDYFLRKSCRISAAHQHRKQLERDACSIKGMKAAGNRKTSKQRDLDKINESKRKKRMLEEASVKNETMEGYI